MSFLIIQIKYIQCILYICACIKWMILMIKTSYLVMVVDADLNFNIYLFIQRFSYNDCSTKCCTDRRWKDPIRDWILRLYNLGKSFALLASGPVIKTLFCPSLAAGNSLQSMLLYFDLVVTTADGFASTFCFFTVMAEFKNVVLMEVNGAFWSNKRPEGEEWEDSKALKKSYLFI